MWPRRRANGAAEDGGFEQIGPPGTSSGPGEAATASGTAKSAATGRQSRGGFGARQARPEEPLSAAQLKMRGIALLARREHSRVELQNKLKRYTDDAALIVQVLEQLQAEKLLSDVRFAEGVARVRGARYGSARVAQDLRARGVSGELAAGLVKDLKASEAERAQAAWDKRFGEAPADAAARAKQMRFLQSRGFASEVIRRVVPRTRQAAPEEAEDRDD
jgi:regulatory protein